MSICNGSCFHRFCYNRPWGFRKTHGARGRWTRRGAGAMPKSDSQSSAEAETRGFAAATQTCGLAYGVITSTQVYTFCTRQLSTRTWHCELAAARRDGQCRENVFFGRAVHIVDKTVQRNPEYKKKGGMQSQRYALT